MGPTDALPKAEAAVLTEEQARKAQRELEQEKEMAVKEALRKLEVELELKHCESIAQQVSGAVRAVKCGACWSMKIQEMLPAFELDCDLIHFKRFSVPRME